MACRKCRLRLFSHDKETFGVYRMNSEERPQEAEKKTNNTGKKRTRLRFLLILLPITAILTAAVIYLNIYWDYIGMEPVTKERLDGLNLDGYNKLMIVAHPDDEFIWGGGHLLSDDYLVVVLTGDKNVTRHAEFDAMMASTGNRGLMLGYPDKVAGRRSNWTFLKDNVTDDLKTVLAYKDWELVVTHNPDGEYGHQHHVYTSQLTGKAYDELGCTFDFYYFGQYYKKDEVPSALESISDELFEAKKDLAPIYESQTDTVNKLYHMLSHENWQKRTR